MNQQQLQTPASVRGKRINGLIGTAIGDRENTVHLLDNMVPLQGASHADVVEYCIEAPMRYAECHAVLADGSKARFAEPRKFLGWSSHDVRRSLLFRNNDITLEVEVDNRATERECSTVRSINLQAAVRPSDCSWELSTR